MRKILTIFAAFVAIFATSEALALDVILENKLQNEYVVVTQLCAFGVTSFIPSNPLIIPPQTNQPAYVVRLKAATPVLYELAISVAKDADHLNDAIAICKTSYSKDKSSWFSFDSSPYVCYEDESIYNEDQVPFSVVVARKDQIKPKEDK